MKRVHTDEGPDGCALERLRADAPVPSAPDVSSGLEARMERVKTRSTSCTATAAKQQAAGASTNISRTCRVYNGAHVSAHVTAPGA